MYTSLHLRVNVALRHRLLESLEGGCQILQYDRNRRDSFVCIVGIEFIEDQMNFHGQDLRLLT